eukprot:6023938-Pleurochrysis_carterae.AAC.1
MCGQSKRGERLECAHRVWHLELRGDGGVVALEKGEPERKRRARRSHVDVYGGTCGTSTRKRDQSAIERSDWRSKMRVRSR